MSLVLCLRPAVYRQGEQSLRRLGRSTFDPFSAARRDNPSFRQLNIAMLLAWKQDDADAELLMLELPTYYVEANVHRQS